MGILNICNLWILLRKIVIYLVGRKCHLHGMFRCKIDGNDVIAGIQSTLPAKKFMKMTSSSDKIYYNSSQENPKITNI